MNLLQASLRSGLVILSLSLASLIPSLPSPPAAANDNAGYEIVTLASLGGSSSRAYDITDEGLVVGHADDAQGRRRAVIWHEGIPEDLGTLGGDDATAIATNANAHVVGSSTTAPGQEIGDPGSYAALWQNGAAFNLGALGGDSSTAQDINAAGVVVGASTTRRGAELALDVREGVHAFVWRAGRMTSLGTLGGDFSYAMAINDAGQVVGLSTTAQGIKHAFLWQDGTMTDLGTPVGHWSAALDINARQQIVGFVANDSAASTPVHWADDAIAPLVSASPTHAAAYALNDANDVVGTAGGHHAFIWRDDQTTSLATLLPPDYGWDELDIARNINAVGQIVGWGHHHGEVHAFIMTPETLTATPIADPCAGAAEWVAATETAMLPFFDALAATGLLQDANRSLTPAQWRTLLEASKTAVVALDAITPPPAREEWHTAQRQLVATYGALAHAKLEGGEDAPGPSAGTWTKTVVDLDRAIATAPACTLPAAD